MFKHLDWYSSFPYPWQEVRDTFMKMPVLDVKELSFSDTKKEEIIEFLKGKDFDPEMTQRSLAGIKNVKTLDKFF